MTKRLCISIDVDSVASHLRGYGIRESSDLESVYHIALPRICECFEQLKVKATFFVVAAEAVAFADSIRQLRVAGHEIASHSLSHPQGFSLLSPSQLQTELTESKRVLETMVPGARIAGFRAPSWSLSVAQLELVAAAGYRYEASLIPSWILPLMRTMIARRRVTSVGDMTPASGGLSELSNLLTTRRLQRLNFPSGDLLRIPVATSPILRLPHYHTVSFSLPDWLFRLNGELACWGTECVSYVLHAVDFLELDDVKDRRIERHPGMRERLGTKLARVHAALRPLLHRAQSCRMDYLI